MANKIEYGETFKVGVFMDDEERREWTIEAQMNTSDDPNEWGGIELVGVTDENGATVDVWTREMKEDREEFESVAWNHFFGENRKAERQTPFGFFAGIEPEIFNQDLNLRTEMSKLCLSFRVKNNEIEPILESVPAAVPLRPVYKNLSTEYFNHPATVAYYTALAEDCEI